MNWIILNGKRSTLIKGLIIRSLPPITKPLVRTSVDTIDGRDGDIVKRLGYAAYDKTVEIGLAGNYDVDQVIEYFSDAFLKPNAEGKVTFSNEPDKYYRYAIYEAIDFERLLRFKTATVTFHVQPFKYSVSDEVVDVTVSNQTSVSLFSRGNIYAKPTITVYGSGTCTIEVGDNTYVTLDMTPGSIKLNSEDLNATSMGMANRYVTGSLRWLWMNPGSNTVKWTGNVTRVIIKDFVRWI